MNGNSFLDTNILVYSYSGTEIEKQAVARRLISSDRTFISTQVLQELYNVLVKKFKSSYPAATAVINECAANNRLHVNTLETIVKAGSIAERYKF